MKKKISRIVKSIFIILLLILFFINSSNAITPEEMENSTNYVVGMIKKAQDDTWYTPTTLTYLGRDLIGNYENSAPISRVGGYCIEDDHEYQVNAPNKVISIIDVTNDPERVADLGHNIVVYSLNTNNTSTSYYNFDSVNSNKNAQGIKYLLRLAWLANKAIEVNEGPLISGNGNSYKIAMPGFFCNQAIVESMHNAGLSDYINTSKNYNYDSSNSSYTKFKESAPKVENLLAKGNYEEYNMQNKSTASNVKVTQKNGKYYIGPYKVFLQENTTVNEIIINDSITPAGIATSVGGTVSNVNTVSSESNFYIVTNSNINPINSIKIKSNQEITKFSTRILISGAGNSQNFIIYGSKSEKTPIEVQLPNPKGEDKKGQILIKKVDAFGIKTNRKDIVFKIRAEKNNKWLKFNGSQIEYVNLEDATELKTNDNGITYTPRTLPVGKYIVAETSIPADNLYYKTIEKGKYVDKKKVEITEADVKAELTLRVLVENERDFFPIRIRKYGGNSKETLDGIGFKLYKKESGWVQFNSKTNVVDRKSVV